MAAIIMVSRDLQPVDAAPLHEPWYSLSYSWLGAEDEVVTVSRALVTQADPSEVYFKEGRLFIGPYELQVIGYTVAHGDFVCRRILP